MAPAPRRSATPGLNALFAPVFRSQKARLCFRGPLRNRLIPRPQQTLVDPTVVVEASGPVAQESDPLRRGEVCQE